MKTTKNTPYWAIELVEQVCKEYKRRLPKQFNYYSSSHDSSSGWTAYNGDTPTGGSRLVRFLDGEGIYQQLTKTGWKYNELVHELKYLNTGDIGRWNREVIYDILEKDLDTTELVGML